MLGKLAAEVLTAADLHGEVSFHRLELPGDK